MFNRQITHNNNSNREWELGCSDTCSSPRARSLSNCRLRSAIWFSKSRTLRSPASLVLSSYKWIEINQRAHHNTVSKQKRQHKKHALNQSRSCWCLIQGGNPLTSRSALCWRFLSRPFKPSISSSSPSIFAAAFSFSACNYLNNRNSNQITVNRGISVPLE